MKRWTAAAAIAVISLVFGSIPAQAAPSDFTDPAPTTPAASDSQTILVTVEDPSADPEATAEAAVTKAAEGVSDAEVTDVQRVTTTTVAVTVSGGLSTAEADKISAAVDASAAVKAASTGTVFHPAATDWEANLWNINAAVSKHSVAADQAWGFTTGTGVTVGVVDTGITANPDLDANVVGGYDFVRYIDGEDVLGAADGDGWDSDPSDEGGAFWHGTHVAGTIAAVKDHSGVVGVAPGAKIEPLRVLGSEGGTEADVIAAVRWAVGDTGVYDPDTSAPLAKNPNPVQVLNLSLGGEGTCSAAMQSAINYAVATKGVPVVVATGNNGMPLSTFSPANCANVIRVAATTYEGKRADYSNYGTHSAPATVSAPGGSSYSTACVGSAGGQCGAVLSTVKIGDGASGTDYGFMWGTSMAAPHVSGVVALLRSLHPGWSVAQVTAAVRGGTTSVSGCSAVQCGSGIVNAGKAVRISHFISRKKPPSISGKFKVRRTLTAKIGTWTPQVKVSYRWLRNGSPITGATKKKYKLTKKDKGKLITVQLTVTGPAGWASRVEVLKPHKVK